MEDEGKGLSKSERRKRLSHIVSADNCFFLEHGRVFAVGMGLVEALHSELCVRGQLFSLEVMLRRQDRTGSEGGEISFKWVSDDCAR